MLVYQRVCLCMLCSLLGNCQVFTTYVSTFLYRKSSCHRPNKRHTYIPLHYITLLYITLHYITLHYIPLHWIALHCVTLHYIVHVLYNITLYCVKYYIILYCILYYIILYYLILNYIILYYIIVYIAKPLIGLKRLASFGARGGGVWCTTGANLVFGRFLCID